MLEAGFTGFPPWLPGQALLGAVGDFPGAGRRG